MTSAVPCKLNVGCGADVRDGYVNIDRSDHPGIDHNVDLDACADSPLPLETDRFHEIEMIHVLEHITNPLALMQELYRVGAPNARLHIKVPFAGHDDAWVDPTHVRAFVPQTFAYFAQPRYVDYDYGYTADWKVERCDLVIPRAVYNRFGREKIREAVLLHRNVGKEIDIDLIAIKPARPRDPALQEAVGYRLIPV